MEQTLQDIKTRRSCRCYQPDMVPHDVLEKIVEAGTWAASGVGRQSAKIIAVTDPALRNELSHMNAAIAGREGSDPFYGAPVVLVVLADKTVGTHIYDGSLVMGNLMLAAHALGVDSCWIHLAKEEFESPEGKALLRKLGIEGEWEGIGHCVLGYRNGKAQDPAPRKHDYVTWA